MIKLREGRQQRERTGRVANEGRTENERVSERVKRELVTKRKN